MKNAAGVLDSFLQFEGAFRGQSWIDFHREHGDIPVIAVGLYLCIIFHGPAYIKKPFQCRPLFALWNLFLCLFSVIGATRVVPVLFHNLTTHGFHYTVCTDPESWYLNGGVGLWTALFIYSKVPELLDTIFLVVQKKPVIFLHWFHHCTVLLYCWHAFHHRIAPGLWFAAMNYCVHAIMYGYYTLCIIGLRSFAKPLAPFITTVQVLQMVGGIVVTATSALTHFNHGEGACHVTGSNYRLGLLMYSSYFVLFVILFYNLYLGKKQETHVEISCPPKGGVGCPEVEGDGEPEKAGLFFFEPVRVVQSDGKVVYKYGNEKTKPAKKPASTKKND